MVLKFQKLWNVYFGHGTLFGYKICLTWNQFLLRQFWLRHDLKPGVVTIFAILIIMMAALYSCECVIREKPPNHNENSIPWIWRKRIFPQTKHESCLMFAVNWFGWNNPNNTIIYCNLIASVYISLHGWRPSAGSGLRLGRAFGQV